MNGYPYVFGVPVNHAVLFLFAFHFTILPALCGQKDLGLN